VLEDAGDAVGALSLDEVHQGAYRPAVFKDGKLVPGTIE
jgi:hypothetical protein